MSIRGVTKADILSFVGKGIANLIFFIQRCADSFSNSTKEEKMKTEKHINYLAFTA